MQKRRNKISIRRTSKAEFGIPKHFFPFHVISSNAILRDEENTIKLFYRRIQTEKNCMTLFNVFFLGSLCISIESYIWIKEVYFHVLNFFLFDSIGRIKQFFKWDLRCVNCNIRRLAKRCLQFNPMHSSECRSLDNNFILFSIWGKRQKIIQSVTLLLIFILVANKEMIPCCFCYVVLLYVFICIQKKVKYASQKIQDTLQSKIQIR